MSYDIYLRKTKCQTCGHVASGPDLPNPTYNLTSIFDLALTGEPLPNANVGEGAVVLLGAKTDRPRGLRILSGRLAADTMKQLSSAAHRLADPGLRAAFEDLAPSNGWGTVDNAIEVIDRLRTAAADFPEHTWEVH
jgi:hypothetical protein